MILAFDLVSVKLIHSIPNQGPAKITKSEKPRVLSQNPPIEAIE